MAHLQAQSENAGAMFQVASNMNGVEGISQETSVEGLEKGDCAVVFVLTYDHQEPSFVSDYIWDKTQGPAASISCGGAALARVYAAFTEGEVFQRQTKQRLAAVVVLLSAADQSIADK